MISIWSSWPVGYSDMRSLKSFLNVILTMTLKTNCALYSRILKFSETVGEI